MGRKEMTRNKARCMGVLAMAGILLSGCAQTEPLPEETEQPKQTVEIAKTVGMEELGIHEDLSVYSQDDPESIAYFYVTVQMGDAGSGTDHTFNEVKHAVRFVNNSHVANDVYARAIVQAGDENGPQPGMLGYGLEKSNATIRIRGNSSSTMPQKSYKLKLDDEAGLWRGQRNLALNKSIFDVTRFRNKLYFDFLKEIPEVSSIRTQFVRLFIKDETAGETVFQDYGFYTQAEVPGPKYLANHGMDRDGYLYKAIAFNFEPSEGLKNFDDPDFEQAAFDQILSCKGRQDNQKLIDLVERINDISIDINDIVGTWIDRENYITWLAYNILLANVDTTIQNFYLYSPVNSEKWFFIPWDGDNMLPFEELRVEGTLDTYGEYEKGISNYWGVMLHQRFLKYRENREELAARVDELYRSINKETVNERAADYDAVVAPYISRMPDFYYLGHTLEERRQIIDGLGAEVDTAYAQFYETLEELMPFFLNPVIQSGEQLKLSWGEAYDFDNEEITYRVTVSRYPDLRDPVIREVVDDTQLETTKEVLSEGIWYWSVKAITKSGKTALPINKIQIGEDWYPGVEILEVQG